MEEIAVENGRISNSQELVSSWPWRRPWIGSVHTVMLHSSTSIYIPNLIEIEETFCGRTYGRTFETHFIRSTLRSRPKNGLRPFQGRFVICRLGLAMCNPLTKFKVSMVTCNKEIKGNAKCTNSRFEPPFGGLRGNAQSSSMARWKAHCRLPISDNWTFLATSHGCGTIKRNLSKSAFSEGVGNFECKF